MECTPVKFEIACISPSFYRYRVDYPDVRACTGFVASTLRLESAVTAAVQGSIVPITCTYRTMKNQ